MTQSAIIDTGPLVALLNRRDTHHAWAIKQMEGLSVPLLTCEAVISESLFLLRKNENAGGVLGAMIQRGILAVAISLQEEIERILVLLEKYRELPISIADACLIRLSERLPKHLVFTIDSDFTFYRRDRNATIPLLMP